MRHGRRILFHLACGLSLLIAIGIGVVWWKSFKNEWDVFSFNRGGEKFVVRSKWGQFVLIGPPAARLENPTVLDLVRKMSNEDFEWVQATPIFVEGDVKRDTPTWEVYQRLRSRQTEGKAMEAEVVALLGEAMEDPNRFVPAHLILLVAMRETRIGFVRMQQRRPPEFFLSVDGNRTEQPGVFVRRAGDKWTPDFKLRSDLREELRQLREVKRGALFHGWIFFAALVLPMAWLTRPRVSEGTWRNWMGNFSALVLGIICLAAAVMWVRSYWVVEQWAFERRPMASANG